MQQASKTRALEAILGSATISLNVNLALALNSLPAAVFLSQAMFWQLKARYKRLEVFQDRSGNDREYFAKSADDWYQETALTPAMIVSARKLLMECGILHERLKGNKVSTQMFYSVDIDAVVSLVQNYLSTGEKACKKAGHKSKSLAQSFRKTTESAKIENGQKVPNTIYTESVKIETTESAKIENAPIILLESNIEREQAQTETDFKVEIFEPVKAETVTVSVAAAGGENDLTDPVTENTKKAIQWAGQNWETVKNWFSIYKIKCPETVTELMPEVMTFYSNQMRGKSDLHEIYRSPVQYFIVSFPYWISCSKQFNRIESKPDIAQPNVPQASGENLTKKSIRKWA